MKLLFALLLLTTGCTTVVKEKQQSKILQCKILCQGGDTFSYKEVGVSCQCEKPIFPVNTKKVVNYTIATTSENKSKKIKRIPSSVGVVLQHNKRTIFSGVK